MIMKRFILGIALCAAVQIGAQTTCKVAGIVSYESNTPLVGANIMLEGTSLGAAAASDGHFYIINVPPGVYNLRVTMMGYETLLLRSVRISVNRTTDVEIRMKPTVLESSEVIVVQAEKVTIKKDQTSSVRNVSAQEIAMLPVENTSDIIGLQAGVVEGHFRGGRSTEVSYLVDGMEVSEVFGGEGRVLEMQKEAIQDLEVITGTFNAEYGKAMSGVVNVVTKDGGNQFHGAISGQLANYYTSHGNIFIGLKPSDITRQQDYKFQVEGPVWKDKITFFANLRTEDNRYHLNGIRRFRVDDYSDFTNYPGWYVSEATGDSASVPLSDNKRISAMGKLTFKLRSAKLSLLYDYDRNDWQNYSHVWKYNPDGRASNHSRTHMLSAQLNHMFTKNMFYELKFYYKNNRYGNYLFEDYADTAYISNSFLRNNDYTGFYTGGQEKVHTIRTLSDYNGKFDLTWQANKTHSLKAGFLYTQMNIDNQEATVMNVGTDSVYVPGIMADTTLYADIYEKNPFEFAAYVQDKMEFDEMVINAGVRFDYYTPETVYPSQRRNPTNAALFEDPSKMSSLLDADPQYQVSPRLGLSYQLGKAAILHFSYGHFFQMPPKYAIYQNNSFLVGREGTTTMGNAQLKAEKTVSYEIGLWQELMDGMSVDVALFYRDIYDLLTVNLVETYYTFKYGLYGNKDYANARGLEVKYDFIMDRFAAMVNYTLQFTRGNADNPSTTFNRLGQNQDPIPLLIPLAWDQRHTLNMTVSYNAPRYSVALTGRYGSGIPYTYSPQEESILSRVNLYSNNNIQPSTMSMDLRANYDVDLGKAVKLRFLFNIYNLLDQLNEISVNTETGRAYTAIIRETDIAIHRSDFNAYIDRIHDPSAYEAPRLIKFGVGLVF